jgi:hypothetical protein
MDRLETWEIPSACMKEMDGLLRAPRAATLPRRRAA